MKRKKRPAQFLILGSHLQLHSLNSDAASQKGVSKGVAQHRMTQQRSGTAKEAHSKGVAQQRRHTAKEAHSKGVAQHRRHTATET